MYVYIYDTRYVCIYVIGSEKTTLIAQNLSVFLCRAKVTSVLSILQFVSGT